MLTRPYVQHGDFFPQAILNTLLLDNTEMVLGFEISRDEFVEYVMGLQDYRLLRDVLPRYLADGESKRLTQDIVRTIIGKSSEHFGDQEGGAIANKIKKIFKAPTSYLKTVRRLLPVSPAVAEIIAAQNLNAQKAVAPYIVKRIIYDDLFGDDDIKPLPEDVEEYIDESPNFKQLIDNLVLALEWLGPKGKPTKVLRNLIDTLYNEVTDYVLTKLFDF